MLHIIVLPDKHSRTEQHFTLIRRIKQHTLGEVDEGCNLGKQKLHKVQAGCQLSSADEAKVVQNNNIALTQKWGSSHIKRMWDVENHQRRPQTNYKDFW